MRFTRLIPLLYRHLPVSSARSPLAVTPFDSDDEDSAAAAHALSHRILHTRPSWMSRSAVARRVGALLLCFPALTPLLPSAAALTDVSTWAEEGVSAAWEAGLEPLSLHTASATDAITRSEFCSVALNLYKTLGGTAIPLPSESPFRDCEEIDVLMAHALHLVNGRGGVKAGLFEPNACIQRQDLCIMLQNVLEATSIIAPPIAGEDAIQDYSDIEHLAGYATGAMTTMVDYGVISGIADAVTGETMLRPTQTTTREQAMIMAERFLTAFQPHNEIDEIYGMDEMGEMNERDKIEESDPINPMEQGESAVGIYRIDGTEIMEVSGTSGTDAIDTIEKLYAITGQNQTSGMRGTSEENPTNPSDPQAAPDWESAWEWVEDTEWMEEWNWLNERVDNTRPNSGVGNDTNFPFVEDQIAAWRGIPYSLSDAEQDKMTQVYGAGGTKYQTEEEVESHMVEIAVKVWRLQSNGSKTTGTAYIQVNENLASTYEAIFDEIYHGAERFPIKDVGCYSWRTGEHSQGTAIDINWEENMEATINDDGTLTPTTGDHWTPGVDPFSIPADGDVVRAFANHGFAWGGNAWRTKRDYMHFSYFGR